MAAANNQAVVGRGETVGRNFVELVDNRRKSVALLNAKFTHVTNNRRTLGKGSRHGIEPDMAVISPEGIVGVVVGTTRNFSTVMPVLHADSRNSVKMKSSGINGSLVWDGRDYRYAQVLDVPTTHQFAKGDTIVTSGQANDFPEGIPVGYVVSAESDPGTGFYRVRVRLATDFNKLSHVYVINNKFRREQQELMNEKQ